MTDRLPCKNPECANRILPETAVRTQGFCMPCVNARKKQEYDDYIRLNRKTINVFAGVSDPVEMLKRVHQPREHDPLISWTPCPFPTDELYLRLTADQASDMAAYAAVLLDEGNHSEAMEIILCLAAFTGANLDDCLRKWAFDDDVDFWSALPFHRSPPDVRDRLLQQVETDAENRNLLLQCLAWIGDEVVVESFARWRQEPPSWRDSLYVPPEDYAREAGWELTGEGLRRNLYFSSCFHLQKQALPQPERLRVATARGDNCPNCTLKLTHLFEIAPAVVGLSAEDWPDMIRIMTCECCSAYGTVYGKIDSQGQPHWSDKNAPSTLAKRNADDWLLLPVNAVELAKPRAPLFAADQFLPTTFSQLGGHPTWIQDAEYPQCPACTQSMMFVAQIDDQDIDQYGEGLIYGFSCPECRTTATTFQQT